MVLRTLNSLSGLRRMRSAHRRKKKPSLGRFQNSRKQFARVLHAALASGRTTRSVIAPSRQTIPAVAVRPTVHAAVRFVSIVVFKSAVNRAAADVQNLRSADLVAAGVCDRAGNQFVDDIFH
jgi:hypothetical protein